MKHREIKETTIESAYELVVEIERELVRQDPALHGNDRICVLAHALGVVSNSTVQAAVTDALINLDWVALVSTATKAVQA